MSSDGNIPEHACVTFPGDSSSSRRAREWVSARLNGRADQRVIEDLQLVASELCANAVQHVSAEAIEVMVDDSDPHWWIVVVTSHTTAAGPPPVSSWTFAEPDAPTGRGLGIVRRLSDRVELTHGDQSVIVRCWRRRVDLEPEAASIPR